MKTRMLALLPLLLLAAPALAVESAPDCATNAAASVLADDVAAKLPVEGTAVPDDFYLTLSCSLLASGLSADEIAALPAGDLLDRAMAGLTLDRSRADALLAILEAMKQAQVSRPEPQVVK